MFLIRHIGSFLWQGFAIEGRIQDGFDAPIAGIVKVERAGAGRFQSFSADGFFQTQDETETKMLITSEGTRIESEIDRIHLFGILTAVNPATGRKEQMMIQKGKAGGYESFDYWNIEEYFEQQAKLLSKIVTEAKPAPKK